MRESIQDLIFLLSYFRVQTPSYHSGLSHRCQRLDHYRRRHCNTILSIILGFEHLSIIIAIYPVPL